VSTAPTQLSAVPPPGQGPGGTPAPAAPESKGGKKRLVLIGAVVVLLLAAVVLKGKLLAPHYRPGQVPPPGAVVSLGTLTTSLADGHLVQTTVQLRLTAAETTKGEGKDQPQLLNSAIATLGQQTYATLLTPAGRDALKAQLLVDFKSVLDQPKGPVLVDAVYLTSFVVQ
jgi:flagellar basal body-associated protein FliL